MKPLERDDPLNRKLVAYAQCFNDLYATVQEFVDGALRKAQRERVSGFVDVKITVEHDKLIVRRMVRRDGEVPFSGRWQRLPVDPETVTEFFERVKPEPEAETKPVDVDASKPAESMKTNPAEQIRQRVREMRALETNLKRTHGAEDAAEQVKRAREALEAAL